MAGITIDDKTRVNFLLFAGACALCFWIGVAYSIALDARTINEKQDVKIEALSEMKTDIAVIKQLLQDRKSK